MNIFRTIRCTSIGKIAVEQTGDFLTRLWLPNAVPDEAWSEHSELLDETFGQIDEYLAGTRRVFNLPLAPDGTSFQLRVWGELARIPWGAYATYGEIAHRIGSPGGARAVGMACNRNVLPIVIPCHRVIGRGGALVGFGGGLELKETLLRLEQSRAETLPFPPCE